MVSAGAKLRALLKAGKFLVLPAVYDGLTARLVEAAGFEAVYVGGNVSGSSLAVSEPQLTMTEQVGVATVVARSVDIPVVCDAGAGFGEPLHTMRTIREFVRAGVAGVHNEDQVFPKRASYHASIVHAIPVKEYVDKIAFACRQRDESDRDFVIIARSDTARETNMEEAVDRVNRAADAGADYGFIAHLLNAADIERAATMCKVPLVYPQARGVRPVMQPRDLQQMGYVMMLETSTLLNVAVHHVARFLSELRETGDYKALSEPEFLAARKTIEHALSLNAAYQIEAQTVEALKGK